MTLLLLAVLISGLTPAPRACSIGLLITSRPASGMLILARALPDTILVPTDTADFMHRERPTPEVLRIRVPAAQRFTALRVSGEDMDLTPGGTFAVVPWAYAADCSHMAWEESARWVTPGEEVLFRIVPTRRTHSDEIVVDVLGWHAPYPSGSFWKHEGRGEEVGAKDDWLTAREYFDLILALPPSHAPGTRAERLEAIERVFATSERWRSRFPGSTILNAYRGR